MGKIFEGIKRLYDNPKLYKDDSNMFDDSQEETESYGRKPYIDRVGATENYGSVQQKPDYANYGGADATDRNSDYGRYDTSDAYGYSDDGQFIRVVRGTSSEKNGRSQSRSRRNVSNDFNESDNTDEINTIRRNIQAQENLDNMNRNFNFPGVAAIDPVSIKEDIGKLLKEIQSDKIVVFCLDKCPDEFERQEIKLFTAGVVFDRNGQFAEIRKDYYIVIPGNAPINKNLKDYIKSSGLFTDNSFNNI